MNPRVRKSLVPVLRFVLVLAFWIGVWAVAVWRTGYPELFPSPAAVAEKLWEMLGTSAYYRTVLHSFRNVAAGIAVSVAGGVLLAFLTWRVRLLRELIYPLMTVVKATPVASFIVLALIWIGTSGIPAFITGLIVLPVVWTNLDEGLRKQDPLLIEVTKAYRMPFLRRMRCLTLPSVRPYFLSALRTSLGLAWKAGIAAEVIARPRGAIGTAINDARQYIEYEEVFAWTLTVILLSLLIESGLMALLGRLEKRREAA